VFIDGPPSLGPVTDLDPAGFTFTDRTNGVLITYDGGNEVYLAGVSAADLMGGTEWVLDGATALSYVDSLFEAVF
ncbi:MAG: hypothetical protein AAFO58_04795, partial [Pseudomonadota bacterium]